MSSDPADPRSASTSSRAPRAPPVDAPAMPLPRPATASLAGNDAAAGPRRRSLAGLAWQGAKLVAAALLAWLMVVLIAMLLYTRLDPPFTTLTLAARITGSPVDQRWVPLARIAPALQKAVIVAEDAGFCRHLGVSLSELEEAIERSRDGVPRGASTISMQLTKNLFLWPQRSYVRKAIEIPLTLVMEPILGKRRILEIYLNVAEWGPGIYGVEAAAQHHFGKPAVRLTAAESALLAVTLPAPLLRHPARPGAHVQRLARIIETRMRSNARADACIRARG